MRLEIVVPKRADYNIRDYASYTECAERVPKDKEEEEEDDDDDDDEDDDDDDVVVVAVFVVVVAAASCPGIVWREMVPCLFGGDGTASKRMAHCLWAYHHLPPTDGKEKKKKNDSNNDDDSNNNNNNNNNNGAANTSPGQEQRPRRRRRRRRRKERADPSDDRHQNVGTTTSADHRGTSREDDDDVVDDDDDEKVRDDGRGAGNDNGNENQKNESPDPAVSYHRRRFTVPAVPHSTKSGKNVVRDADTATAAAVVLWIQPPTTVAMESTFGGLLIRWEHELMRATSLAGYFSTLGGGFFMCSHWKTAVRLAGRQQRAAQIIGDRSMYYRCALHQSYSYVHAGKFRAASDLIDRVLEEIATPDAAAKSSSSSSSPYNNNALDPSLVPMCHSAKLFCRRVKKASRKLRPRMKKNEGVENNDSNNNDVRDDDEGGGGGVVISKTVDDFSRIRLVEDHSTDLDLIASCLSS